ncbi:MAG TPA: hypothetical protein VGK73_11500 [Polyangiaceae bacterium]
MPKPRDDCGHFHAGLGPSEHELRSLGLIPDPFRGGAGQERLPQPNPEMTMGIVPRGIDGVDIAFFQKRVNSTRRRREIRSPI